MVDVLFDLEADSVLRAEVVILPRQLHGGPIDHGGESTGSPVQTCGRPSHVSKPHRL